jgi:hypothetical protein
MPAGFAGFGGLQAARLLVRGQLLLLLLLEQQWVGVRKRNM